MNKTKRVVSIGEYVRHQCRYFAKGFAGASLLIVGWSAGIISSLVVFLALSAWTDGLSSFLGGVIVAGVVALISPFFKRWGSTLVLSAEKMEPVVPLTRTNADLLPEEDVLVRAASEPTTPQSVLLRAAAPGGGAENEKELLRASITGGKEAL